MSERFKLAYIGAGSFRFSLGLFRNIVNTTELLPMEVALCDINAESLKLMAKILKRMIKKAAVQKKYSPSQILVTESTDHGMALENADMVYKSISVGLQAAEWYDIFLPWKLGIPQNTGDTCGPGGVFRGLRTNPTVRDIVQNMKRLCPKALLLNYTNPQASIVLTAYTVAPDIQFIGLCHGLFEGMRAMRSFFNKTRNLGVKQWEDFEIAYGGINHFGWLTEIGYNGEDLYPILRQHASKLIQKGNSIGNPLSGFNYFLLDKYGYLPYLGARHIAEFLPDYYNYFNHEIQSPYWKFPMLRNVANVDRERHLTYRMFRMMAARIIGVPGPAKAGEKAMEMTLDWKNNNPTPYVVNIPNKGIIPQLPGDSIVEIPALFKNGHIRPKQTIQLSNDVAKLIRPHAEQQRLTVDAGLRNSYDAVVRAMQHDPMCKWVEDEDRIEWLTKLMLYYQKEWLPEEWQSWIPKKEELEQSKYWVSAADLARKNDAFRICKYPAKKELKEKAFFWPDN
jgi:alpha-galactosidase/6-phospho-beta-glucosidase family protein